jgi:hypothetical protein
MRNQRKMETFSFELKHRRYSLQSMCEMYWLSLIQTTHQSIQLSCCLKHNL